MSYSFLSLFEAFSVVRAKGRLRHRWWGEYSAVIILQFPDPDSAQAAAPKLTPEGSDVEWKPLPQNPEALTAVLDIKQLSAVKRHFAAMGADIKKIDSLQKSVDYGEPFTITVPLAKDPEWANAPSANMVQPTLFGD